MQMSKRRWTCAAAFLAVSATASGLSADGVLSAQEVAQAALKGPDEGGFLILPHAVVEDYRRRKSEDYDRWIAGMSKLARRRPS